MKRSAPPRPSGPVGSPSVGPPSNCGGPASRPGAGEFEGAPFGEWVFSPGKRPSAAPHRRRPGPLVRRAVRRRPTWSGSASIACATPWPPSWWAGASSSGPNTGSGHRDPSTTLRNYAHALPLEDGEVADDIDVMLGAVVASESTSLPSPTAAAGPSLPHGSGASASVFSDSGLVL